MDGLLFVLSEPPAGSEEAFHEWYDEEHGPLRLAVDGIFSGYRYRAVDGETPSWLAWYELQLSALQTEGYTRLRANRSVREQGIISGLVTLDRRIYRLVHGSSLLQSPSQMLLVKSLAVDQPHADELRKWYVEEHIPMLSVIPGWSSTRLYELEDGAAPRFMAMHHLADAAVFDTDQYRKATSTPWRSTVMSRVTASERRLFGFHSAF